ncbi:hypothetical protein DEU56DRAFT_818324 [Suillus clintonianus]|uniref:uncharacterized protein n=1 Tax=Suillus clintonianus TaxID=1904413 RepID=UPI001B8637F2|nr:uncharacterized protein DEU56DRAFT_818324 [Suillus clintonianus]KAG2129002.1 hypothetical protein DEU56DRAFT_818324 [Suillus clintonianus]
MDTQETVVYTYNLLAGNAPLQFSVLVEPEPDQPNHYTLSLSMKAGHVERALCAPVTLRLSIDPRRLDFSVFVFPPRTSLPAGCLYNLRVWLKTAGVDHRIFSDNDLWVGRDPDFRSVGDACFAVLRNATQDMLIYQGAVGHAHVSYIIRWKLVEVGLYSLSLEYEAGGAGRTLLQDCYMRLDCEPQIVTFMIYAIPVTSTPPGASHRLRFWLRTPFVSQSPASSAVSQSDSYIYQRLWKSDEFKLGSDLNFDALGSKLAMGVRDPDSPRIERDLPCLNPSRRRSSRTPANGISGSSRNPLAHER